jgi:hypothetical protein
MTSPTRHRARVLAKNIFLICHHLNAETSKTAS